MFIFDLGAECQVSCLLSMEPKTEISWAVSSLVQTFQKNPDNGLSGFSRKNYGNQIFPGNQGIFYDIVGLKNPGIARILIIEVPL